MAYKTIRKDGRNITIDTTTGQEVRVGQGALKPLFNILGLSNLKPIPLTLKQMGADIQNLPGDISRHLIYSDQVDKKGRPLTIAQANPQPRQLIPEIEAYLARNGKSKQVSNKDEPMFSDLRGSSTPGSMTPAVDNSAADRAFAKAAEFQKANNPLTPAVEPKAPVPPGILATGVAKLDPNATEEFKTAFNAGNNNMDQIQAMYADGPEYKNTGKTALQLWAEANPALAQKEYLKKAFNTDGTPKILDKTEEGFDKPDAPGVVESINGSTLQNPISINTLNEVLDKSEEAENAQEFLKNFIATGQYLTN